MLHHLLATPAQRLLQGVAHSRHYVLLVSLLACASTLSMLVPFSVVLVPAVLLRPRDWRRLWLGCACGSACGAALLVLVFHHLGWQQLYQHYPELQDSASWQLIALWLSRYGLLTLAVIAALPTAQTPALVLCSLTPLPLGGLLLALWLGKLVKYGVVCATTRYFPRYVHFSEPRGHGE
jgi:membrane protein YqaA with SNARE-associated domain